MTKTTMAEVKTSLKKVIKRYMTDKWFSRIVGSLGRSCVLRHLHSSYT